MGSEMCIRDRWWVVHKPKYEKLLNEKKIQQKEFDEREKKGTANPYNTGKAGTKKWGGLTKAGIDRLVELKKEIEQNRKDNAEFIKEVEERGLKAVRFLKKRDSIDENKKPVKPKTVAVPLVDEKDLDEDDTENGFV